MLIKSACRMESYLLGFILIFIKTRKSNYHKLKIKFSSSCIQSLTGSYVEITVRRVRLDKIKNFEMPQKNGW